MKASWFWVDSGPGGAAYNMAFDEALLEGVQQGAYPIFRSYGWNEAGASFGYFQRYREVERMTVLRPLVRRPTGGGLVPHAADWTYSVIIPADHAWYGLRAPESYRRMHGWVAAALRALGLGVSLAETAGPAGTGQCFLGPEPLDVLWEGHKVAGAAQRRKRAGLLIQGSIQPPGQWDLRREDWLQAMRGIAEQEQGAVWNDYSDWEPQARRVGRLLELKYGRPEYHRRR